MCHSGMDTRLLKTRFVGPFIIHGDINKFEMALVWWYLAFSLGDINCLLEEDEDETVSDGVVAQLLLLVGVDVFWTMGLVL